MGKKSFEGSWLILILLIILCWPAALIYFFLKYDVSEEGETRTCMGCGAQILLQYTTCPYCGRSTTGADQQYQAPRSVAAQPSGDEAFCKNCGGRITPEQDFCIGCGAKLK
ncbi:MAG: hypothetical protein WC375_10470 [Methanomassiliicoccales archaeon]|jgi:RNA polymerase subunit RPABC4/transcription elongation factor Spt4